MMTAALDIAKLLNRNLPTFAMDKIESVAREYFNIEGTFKRLSSERDQSYKLAASNGDCYILKVSNAQDAPEVIDFQTQALIHINEKNPDLPVPRIIKTVTGENCTIVTADHGEQHVVRLLSFLPGVMISENASLNTATLRRNIGQTIAKLDHALHDFFHPNSANSHPWDMMAFMVYRQYTHHISNAIIRQAVEGIFDHADTLMPKLKALRHQVVHQDAHSGNLLLNLHQPEYLAGIIDFGDMLYGPLMMDLVVACDLMMQRVADPVSDMCDIIAGFNSELELEEQEIDLLYDMILVRNAITIAVCEWRSSMCPDEAPYVSDLDLFEGLLTRLLTIGRTEITARFHRACCCRFKTAQ